VAAGALILDEADEAMLAGDHGAASALAMRMVVAVAQGMRATRLLDITGAHIDGCIYYGRVCLDWAKRFRELGARVRVPTTLNIGLLDLLHPGLTDVPDERARPARELMEAYVELGAKPTFTCAPYQLAGSRPRLGEHVAWAESNAIVFANSVLGARTNRYGDFCDVACAVTGRAPAAGLHLTAERRARVVLDVSGLSDAVLASDVLYPVLGLVLGRTVGDRVAVIDGLPPGLHEDQLKAIGAAAASTGAVAMFHAVGSTPEAATLADALQGEPAGAVVEVAEEDLRAARDLVQTARTGAPLDGVAVGTPHASADELRRMVMALDGAPVRIPVWVNTSRGVLADLDGTGVEERLHAAGVKIVVDTCTYTAPVISAVRGTVMTSSGKWAYYAPGNIGVDVAFGSLEECVRSAVAGQIVRDDGFWA
jgi:predicted aconitase